MFLSLRHSRTISFLSLLLGTAGLYASLVISIFFVFLFTRLPYVYDLGAFGLFLFWWIVPLFLSFFLSRLVAFGPFVFLSSLLPNGTPLWISPLVVLAETVSYLVRPAVLLLRPFLNISIGSLGGAALGSLFFIKSGVLLFLFILFFYEIFVAAVHWFIVCNILSFSESH